MTRVFRRGELKTALLHVLAATEPANGYTIMQRLTDQMGADWRASPGAIYPALLALEDAGHIAGIDDGGSRVYTLTNSGRRICDDRPGLLDDVARRVFDREPRVTLGDLLDAFVHHSAHRSRALDPTLQREVRAVLAEAGHRIASLLDQGETHE
jgi:DNA-binding PadR family transcriptional regulator